MLGNSKVFFQAQNTLINILYVMLRRYNNTLSSCHYSVQYAILTLLFFFIRVHKIFLLDIVN